MNKEIEINGNDSDWEQKCRRLAEDHQRFALVNFNLEKMLAFCDSTAKKYAYELKVLREQKDVCHFIPREYYREAVPIKFSGNPED